MVMGRLLLLMRMEDGGLLTCCCSGMLSGDLSLLTIGGGELRTKL